MDQKLLDEIVSRVAAKLAQAGETGESCSCTCPCSAEAEKPGLLVLTQEHGECCHTMLESEILKTRFRTECALLNDYQTDLSAIQAVVLYGLTNEALAKLAGGICDTPYTRLAAQAILTGKQVYVPSEEVELYRYADTAPAPYYAMLQDKLKLLMDSGVMVCPQNDLENVIVGVPAPEAECPCARPAETAKSGARPAKEVVISKRVLTERDVSEASAAQVTCIRVSAKCILTDLAKDYAKVHGICLIKEE